MLPINLPTVLVTFLRKCLSYETQLSVFGFRIVLQKPMTILKYLA